jgi:hypothetical protein
LLRGDMKAEPGSEIIAAQNLVSQTNNHATKVLKIEIENEFNLVNIKTIKQITL